MPNNTNTSAANFNDLMMAEVKVNAIKTLKTHPRDVLDRVLYAVNRVFVAKDSDEDTVATKMEVAAIMLESLAASLRDPANPLNVQFPVDEEGNYLGNYTFKIATELATTVVPEQMIARSEMNRVRAAAKKFGQG